MQSTYVDKSEKLVCRSLHYMPGSLSLSLGNDLATYEKCHFSFVSDR